MATDQIKDLVGHLHLPFLLLVILISINPCTSNARTTISLNHSLSGRDTIISENGKFALGFFRPGNKTRQTFYIGIWFNKISEFTPVWVANREAPVINTTTSELRISNDGNLVLLDESKQQIWSTNSSSVASSGASVVAMILNSGNLVLVLRDDVSNSNPSKVFWQSFDYPTDTFLPGFKLGINKVTGEEHQLTSWKNSEDPSPGSFSLSIDPNGSGQFLCWWNRSKVYWNSGLFNGQTFQQVPGSNSASFNLSYEYISNATMNYFTYYVPDYISIRSIVTILGQDEALIWLEDKQQWVLFWAAPQGHCDVYAVCGPFSSCNQMSTSFCSCLKGFGVASQNDWSLNDFSKGCAREIPLQCGGSNNSREGDTRERFFVMTNVILPDNPTHSLGSRSVEECEHACLSNCSCSAYSYSSSDPCSLWHGELLNLQQSYDGSNRGKTLYLRVAASEVSSSKSKKRVDITVAVVATGGGLLAFLAFVLTLIRIGRKRRTTTEVEGTLVSFQYNDLKQITKNFSERLGGGAFGSVFKGTLPDSTAIAVKRLGNFVYHGEKQFRAEVSTIGTTQHVNLVRLYGFCSEGTKKLLVYEYMPRGSLERILFQRNSTFLEWEVRYQIALGAAKGLSYLHEKCRDCIIHCDIKPENILLDDSFTPKVADFGMAKLVGRDFSRVLTTMRGTKGYLAPEWIYGTAITAKADVYSYGMMLFEIISGRRNAEKPMEGRDVFFPLLAARKILEGDVLSLLDPQLEGNTNLKELETACKVACWCVQDDETHRPSMGQVVQILEGFIEVSSPPIPRSFQVLTENSESMMSTESDVARPLRSHG